MCIYRGARSSMNRPILDNLQVYPILGCADQFTTVFFSFSLDGYSLTFKFVFFKTVLDISSMHVCYTHTHTHTHTHTRGSTSSVQCGCLPIENKRMIAVKVDVFIHIPHPLLKIIFQLLLASLCILLCSAQKLMISLLT